MSMINDNPTLSCLIMQDNIQLLKQYITNFIDFQSKNDSNVLKVDGVQFEYCNYGLWVRTQIPNQQSCEQSSSTTQITNKIQNIRQTNNCQCQKYQIRQKQLKLQILYKNSEINRLNQIISAKKYQIEQFKSNLNSNTIQIQNKSNIYSSNSNDTALTLNQRANKKAKANKLLFDGQQMINVEFSFDVAAQTKELQETSIIQSLNNKIKQIQQQLMTVLNLQQDQIIVQEQITIADVQIQTDMSLNQINQLIKLSLNNHSSSSQINQNKNRVAHKDKSKKIEEMLNVNMNSQERKNFHKRGMIQSEKKKNQLKKAEEKIKIVDRVVEIEVERIVERLVQIPVEVQKIVQVIKQKIIQVPVERMVEKIIQLPRKQIIKQIQVQKIIQVPKIIQKIVEIEKPIQIQKIVKVQVQVQKIVQVEKKVQVEKIVQVQKIIQIQLIRQVEVQKVVYVQKIVQVPIQKEIIIQQIQVIKHADPIIQKQIEYIQIQRIVQVPIQIPKIVQVEREVLKVVEVQVIVEKKINHLVQVPVQVKIVQPQSYPVETLVIIEIQVEKIVQVPVFKQQEEQNQELMKFVQQNQTEQKCVEDHQSKAIHLELTNRLDQITNKYQQVNNLNANYLTQIAFYQKQIQKYQVMIAEFEQLLEDTKRQSRDLATQCDSQINQYIHLKERLQTEIESLKQSKHKIQQNYILEQQKRSLESLNQQKDMDSLLEQLTQLKDYIDSLKLQIIDSEQRMTRVNEEKNKAIYDYQSIELQYNKLQQEYRNLQKDTEGLYTEFKQRQQQINSIIQQHQQKQLQGKHTFQQHMRNLIEKYQQLQDKNRFTTQQLQKYIQEYKQINNMLVEVTKQRDTLYDKLIDIQQKLPTDRQFGLEQYNELLQALQSAKNEIVQLKQQISKVHNLQQNEMMGKHDEQLSLIKERYKSQPNSKQLVNKLFNLVDQSIYDYKKLDGHCQKLRQIVVEYQLKNQQPISQDSQQLKQLLERVVDQLQKQRYQKDILQQDMQKMINTLYQYQQALIEKQQEVNYFRIKVTERNKNKYMMKSSKSNDNLLRSQRSHKGYDHSHVQYRNDASNRDSDRMVNNSNSNFNRKKLSNQQISIFKNGYQNGILNKNKYKNNNPNLNHSRSVYNTSILQSNQSRVDCKTPVSLKFLVDTGYISKLAMLTIMLKLAEKAQQQIKNGSLYLTSESVIIYNFKQLSPQSIQIQLTNTHNPFSLKEFSQASVVWNLGMIFDELMHKKLFFSSPKDITNPEDNYKFKSISMSELKKTVTKALLKTPQQRISLSNLIFSLSLEVRKIRG